MKKILLGLAFAAALGATAHADSDMYKVTITNVTKGQVFAPVVVASHKPGASIFIPGAAASDALAALAEMGAPDDLVALLDGAPGVKDVAHTGVLLPPGASATVYVKKARRVSIAGMLVSTNDGFVGLNGVAGPREHRTAVYNAPAWDAGSELNDELCANLPGPPCDPAGTNDHVDEVDGVVHIHNGIHGIGDLSAAERDWRNPVAVVYISRVDGRKDDDD